VGDAPALFLGEVGEGLLPEHLRGAGHDAKGCLSFWLLGLAGGSPSPGDQARHRQQLTRRFGLA
jgi:hypothetical protein